MAIWRIKNEEEMKIINAMAKISMKTKAKSEMQLMASAYRKYQQHQRNMRKLKAAK